MNPDVSLCDHHRSESLEALRIGPQDVLTWFDGPILALATCPECGAMALLEFLDWDEDGRIRVYAFSGLDRAAVGQYQHNTARGSCDVRRFGEETDALLSQAGPVERIVALEVDGYRVCANVAAPQGLTVPVGPWEERLPAPDDERWFERVGIVKHGAEEG